MSWVLPFLRNFESSFGGSSKNYNFLPLDGTTPVRSLTVAEGVHVINLGKLRKNSYKLSDVTYRIRLYYITNTGLEPKAKITCDR